MLSTTAVPNTSYVTSGRNRIQRCMPKPIKFQGLSSAHPSLSRLRHPCLASKAPLRKVTLCALSNEEDVGAAGTATIGVGLVAVPVVCWSLLVLKNTGCGLPPGPGGSLGALEGISYLVVLAIVGWSAFTKSKTGFGLSAGPFGLLGAVEGFSYLALLAMIVVGVLQLLNFGFIPAPLPSAQCFG
eukprot:CAMPEP_0196594012 /NCGR_PEP_ID=MMETSP1081-20130531/77136_1 /TAXON_ID=36882 /ORGANISM="Pyramimonas amylifera, Strain CCMP720" /LENGTH=184 /DNA_ID=CAMNT_0041918157 /DNA_START=92 /DNA_END=646 /DNA_ORIENTATION=-